MRKQLVLGNWKMNGALAFNARLIEDLMQGIADGDSGCEVGVCVPFIYVAQVGEALGGSTVRLGVQDISAHTEGAYTGEISAKMASEFGVSFALVGHSERRIYHHESAEIVGVKALRCLEAGITPVVCVGETLDEREMNETNHVVERQLTAVLDCLGVEDATRIVIAYEPVWAIGTGRSASAGQAQETHAFLRQVLDTRSSSLSDVPVLYGGSVKSSSAADLLRQSDVDGGLVGGASLHAGELAAIVAAMPRRTSQAR
ncbi:triose-phosphate isomerase [Paraburkholderia sp. BL25I1N1]|uniref:triose-phosphate isomerase n=1 Tax=Paraburkholderia sp. BL25I1N1 TaxID=1938804 RepID=UPI000D07EFFD|nr:triose-phosphate isomerase [Paraburkholderia sp. BL25I1N1]PRY04528.1 triosephosphate isomerase [Paraburkholderia sp. BL25I1N1]